MNDDQIRTLFSQAHSGKTEIAEPAFKELMKFGADKVRSELLSIAMKSMSAKVAEMAFHAWMKDPTVKHWHELHNVYWHCVTEKVRILAFDELMKFPYVPTASLREIAETTETQSIAVLALREVKRRENE